MDAVGSCDLAPCLGVGRLGFRARKIPHLRIQIRHICIPPRSLIRLHPHFDSADEQRCWLRLLLRHCRYELSLLGYECWLLQAPSHFLSHSQILSDWAHRLPYNSLSVRSEWGLPQSDPQYWGMVVCSGCSSLIRWTRGLGETSLHGMHCPEGGAMPSVCSYFSNAICSHLRGAGGASASPPCSRVLSVVFCSWIDVSSPEGNEVRNDLCCQLGDIVLPVHCIFNIYLDIAPYLAVFSVYYSCFCTKAFYILLYWVLDFESSLGMTDESIK